MQQSALLVLPLLSQAGLKCTPKNFNMLCRSCCLSPSLWSQQQLWCLLSLLAMEHRVL